MNPIGSNDCWNLAEGTIGRYCVYHVRGITVNMSRGGVVILEPLSLLPVCQGRLLTRCVEIVMEDGRKWATYLRLS